MHHLFKFRKIIKQKEVRMLIFEIRKGSLKISSSIIGNKIITLNVIIGVNSNSKREGYKFK